MNLRIQGRCLQRWNEPAGKWEVVRWFRSGEGARRGLARRLRDPTISSMDGIRAAYKALRLVEKAGRKRWGKAWRTDK